MIRRAVLIACTALVGALALAGPAAAGEKCFEIPPGSGQIYCVTTP